MAGVVEDLCRKYTVKNIFIDITGSTSCGLLDVLKAKNKPVLGINFAQKPYVDRYLNARCEMYVEVSNAVKNGMFIGSDDIKTQLSYTTVEVNSSGKLQLVKKERIKELIGHSPDEADSFALAVYAMNHQTVVKEADHAREVSAKYLAAMESFGYI